LNLRAAYIHVLADAFTSVLAIIALTGGKFAGWSWLDPIMGIVGSGVVFSWAYALMRDTSGILLDRTPPSSDLPDEIRSRGGKGWRFARNRSARLAGWNRKVRRHCLDRCASI
jgi:Co/Zn/Cd efflux system component